MQPVFERETLVRFGHCDPSGIVFFPRYFELLQAFVEDWFNDGLGVRYASLLEPRRISLPSVQLQTRFERASREGDTLTQRLWIERVGRRSITLRVSFDGPEGTRVAFGQVLVCTSLETQQSQPLPEDVRAALVRAVQVANGD
ncbi:4-hydroxybenzoyl-CoA thioesterase [Roseateles sp. YR242]|uniref:acyl-CoA thioesterase n=1 Tax=Roseateles sp. YR242 TaxID=1855305 RepID=UPI0008D777F2|nr:thioesterase family protein [Roseateles sp. YR242]SEK38029.1 4-hydroxybenzoyl-CoA thioesterase [Roseateles sp. YR242]